MIVKEKILQVAKTGISDLRQLAVVGGFDYRELKSQVESDADLADSIRTLASMPAAKARQALAAQMARLEGVDYDKDAIKIALDSLKSFEKLEESDETKGNVINVFFVPVAPSEERLAEKAEAQEATGGRA